MLADSFRKVKDWGAENHKDLLIAGIIFFTGLSSFGLGRLSVVLKPAPPILITDSSQRKEADSSNAISAIAPTDTRVVASRNGASYYFAWCSGVKRIKEENKIWFSTKEAAEKAGLKQAANCSGLQ